MYVSVNYTGTTVSTLLSKNIVYVELASLSGLVSFRQDISINISHQKVKNSRMRNSSSHRALSSIVTSMVLLVATVILGSAVVMWSNGSFSVSKAITTTLYTTNVNKFTEQLVIENVWFGTTPSKFINVTLYDVGSTGISITDIQIKNSTKTVDVPITHGNISPLKTNSTKIPYGWASKIPVSIIITTTKGSVITKDVSP